LANLYKLAKLIPFFYKLTPLAITTCIIIINFVKILTDNRRIVHFRALLKARWWSPLCPKSPFSKKIKLRNLFVTFSSDQTQLRGDRNAGGREQKILWKNVHSWETFIKIWCFIFCYNFYLPFSKNTHFYFFTKLWWPVYK